VTEKGVQFIPESSRSGGIASRSAAPAEMVSRIFKDLVQGHYITIETDRIVINRKRRRNGDRRSSDRAPRPSFVAIGSAAAPAFAQSPSRDMWDVL